MPQAWVMSLWTVDEPCGKALDCHSAKLHDFCQPLEALWWSGLSSQCPLDSRPSPSCCRWSSCNKRVASSIALQLPIHHEGVDTPRRPHLQISLGRSKWGNEIWPATDWRMWVSNSSLGRIFFFLKTSATFSWEQSTSSTSKAKRLLPNMIFPQRQVSYRWIGFGSASPIIGSGISLIMGPDVPERHLRRPICSSCRLNCAGGGAFSFGRGIAEPETCWLALLSWVLKGPQCEMLRLSCFSCFCSVHQPMGPWRTIGEHENMLWLDCRNLNAEITEITESDCSPLLGPSLQPWRAGRYETRSYSPELQKAKCIKMLRCLSSTETFPTKSQPCHCATKNHQGRQVGCTGFSGAGWH